MITTIPNYMHQDETLGVSSVMENFQAISFFMNENREKATWFSTLEHDVTGITNASTQAQCTLRFTPSVDMRLVHSLCNIEQTSTGSCTYTVKLRTSAGAAVVGWTDYTVVDSAVSEVTQACTLDAGTTYDLFIVGSVAVYSVTSGYILLDVATTRTVPEYTPPMFTAADTCEAAGINAAFTAYAAAVDADTNTLDAGVENIPLRNVTAATALTVRTYQVPQVIRKFVGMRVIACADAASIVTATLVDEAGNTVATATAVGAGTGTISTGTEVLFSNSTTNQQSTALNWTLVVAVSAGTCHSGHVLFRTTTAE